MIPNTLSRSASITERRNDAFQFSITNYSTLKEGDLFASESFTIGFYKWNVYFKVPENSSRVLVYVRLDIHLQPDPSFRGWFELTLLDQSGKGNHKVYNRIFATYSYLCHIGGYYQLMEKEDFEMSDYLKNDRLDIKCSIEMIQSLTLPRDPQTIATIQPPEQTLGRHLGWLYESGIRTDVIFSVQGETFKAHKLVLAARSPVFKAQLMGAFSEGRMNLILIEDILPPIFEAMLKFMYTDSITIPEDCTSEPASFYQHLFIAADRYILERLRLLCESKLCKCVKADTVGTTLVLSEIHGASHLKKACLRFAADNLAAVIQSDGYDYVCKNYPLLITDILKAVCIRTVGVKRKRSEEESFP